MADENFEDDIFDDLYDEEPSSKPSAAAPAAAAPPAPAEPEPAKAEPAASEPVADYSNNGADNSAMTGQSGFGGGQVDMGGQGFNGGANQSFDNAPAEDDNYGPINVKEDGKMFIGGLNWETTEQSLKDYFSQFGEVSECTVMRDSATGRSRGFGFLTFKDPKCVNIVMVKEHFLDGKIIDPKRAIPREEQERTSKIFVGGVSQEATEDDFKNFFKQFGRVVDATLMMDKDTGRPRGFGFVTFDGDAAVDATLQGPLQILGKPIEVKRAQPRGNMRDGEDDKKFGRGGKFGNRDNGGGNGGFDNQQAQNQQMGGNGNMTPAMMAQYWQRMQQYFQQMQQQLAAAQGGGMPNAMGGMQGGMNPAMMQQMMAGMNRGTGSPMQGQMGGGQMNPMMQQMQQMQQMQMQQQQQQQGGGGGGAGGNGGGNGGYGGNNQAAMMAAAAAANRPGYTAQEQLAFEQQKYEQQQARRMQQQAGYGGQGGPTSWEGMYDDIPQPAMPPTGPGGARSHGGGSQSGGGGGKHGRGRQGSSQPPVQPGNAPANAPTGPKNAGKPGANYRGGGRNQSYRHNPYGGRGG